VYPHEESAIDILDWLMERHKGDMRGAIAEALNVAGESLRDGWISSPVTSDQLAAQLHTLIVEANGMIERLKSVGVMTSMERASTLEEAQNWSVDASRMIGAGYFADDED
jgi:hypothetical protein